MKVPRRQFLNLATGAVALPAVLRMASAQTSPTRTVRIAHQVDFAPIADVRDGQSVGLGVEVVRAAAALAGVDVEFVPVPFEQVQRTLDDGRAVAIFPLAITPERQRSFDFSAPLYEGGGALFVRAPGVTPEGLAALSGKVVVTPRTGPLAAFIERTAPTVKLVVTTNYEESLARLMRGEAEAAALNYHVGATLAARLQSRASHDAPHVLHADASRVRRAQGRTG